MIEVEKINPEKWVDNYGDALYKHAYFRVGNAVLAEELVSETFVAAVGSIKNFRAESTEKTWLMSILKYKILDYYRKKGRERPMSELESEDEDESWMDRNFNEKGHLTVSPKEWGKDPHESMETKEFWTVFQSCLSGLPEKTHQVYMLKELEDHSIADVCKVLGLSTTNVSVILYRARMKLKACLEAKWFN